MNPSTLSPRIVSPEQWLVERRALLGEVRRRALHLRHASGPAAPVAAVPGPTPAAGAALHVRPGLGGGLPELLVHGRPPRCDGAAPGAARHHAAGGVARAAGRHRTL